MHILSASDGQNNVIVSAFCESYHRRRYFVWRIEKVIELFMSFEQNKGRINFGRIITADDYSRFFHPRIKKMVRNIQKQKSLKSLFRIWEDIKWYRSLDDTELMQGFGKATLVILANIFFQVSKRKDILKKVENMYHHALLLSPLAQLDYVQQFALCIEAALMGNTCSLDKICLCQNVDTQLFEGKNAKNSMIYKQWQLNGVSYTEAITYRRYCCKRLSCAIQLLAQLSTKRTLLHSCFSTYHFYIGEEKKLPFKQKRIIDCVQQIKEQKTVIPVLRLWLEVRECRCIDDPVFSREFSFLLLLVFNNILMHVSRGRGTNKISTQQVVQTYQQLESLPLEEMLNTIDLLSAELPKLIEQYEINTKISWQKWIEKYWWRFPVEVIKLLFKVLLAMRPRPSMFYPHYQNQSSSYGYGNDFSLLDDVKNNVFLKPFFKKGIRRI